MRINWKVFVEFYIWFQKEKNCQNFSKNELKAHSTHISPYFRKKKKKDKKEKKTSFLYREVDLSQPNPAGWILTDNMLWTTSSCRFCSPELPNYSTSKSTLLILEFCCPKSMEKWKDNTEIFSYHERVLWVLEAFLLLYKPTQSVLSSLQLVFSQAIHAMEVTPLLCKHPCSQWFRCKWTSNSSYKSIFTKSLALWSTQENTDVPNEWGHKVHENHVCHLVFIPPFFCNLIS